MKLGKEMVCWVHFHFEGIYPPLQKFYANCFMEHRSEVVAVFNEHIDEVNEEFASLKKPYAFGDYAEDINPEYIKFVQDRIQPFIDELNKRFYICKYRVDEYGDIVGYAPWDTNSKIWVTLEPVNEKES